MLSRRAKQLFFQVASPLMTISAFFYKTMRAPRKGFIRVHLGPGQERYIPGWINVDANIFTGKCDVWADLRNPLPFLDNTVDCFYSHHVVEHLQNIQRHFAEVFRCLKPGGVYRVAGPNGDAAIIKFSHNDSEWFLDHPDKRGSIGGRFENFIFCRGEHVTILTFSYMEELLLQAGFGEVSTCQPVRGTQHLNLFSDCLSREYEADFDFPHTLVVEAVKPF